MCLQLNTFWESVTSGIIGSLIAALLTFFYIYITNYYNTYVRNEKFKKIFGIHETENLYLVVPSLEVRSDVLSLMKSSNLPNKTFPLMQQNKTNINSSKLLAYADIISLKYVLNIIASKLEFKSVVMTDEDLLKKLDLSFLSFGGSNFYCTYVISQENNQFYKFDYNTESIVKAKNPEVFFKMNNDYDYGFIIKYKHDNFPKRTWILVAGLGESGTRGAGWFLSANWEKLADDFNDQPFGLVVRVNHGIDNSAIEVDRISLT